MRKGMASLFYHKAEEYLFHPVTNLMMMGIGDFTRKGGPKADAQRADSPG